MPLGVQFVNIAREAGLRSKTIFGSERKNLYLLETTGCGAAFFDYDNDGWLDIFLVNGTRFEANYAKGDEPTNRLYKNNRDGTFTDMTAKAGLPRTGWGQGVCVGDYDNDGHEDLFITIGAIARSITTTETAPSPMSRRRPASPLAPRPA